MTTLSDKLFLELKVELKNAQEIWVAVGLLNNVGLEFILKAIPESCELNFIVGVNLPTDPKALTKLLKYNIEFVSTAQISTDKFFHPKVYIIRKGSELTAFVGSANATNGGFKDNIEMSIQIKDSIICNKLIDWFEKTLLPKSEQITPDFIKAYKPKYDKRMKRQKQDQNEIKELQEKVKKEQLAEMKKAGLLISKLKRYRNSKAYIQHKESRKIDIKELKKDIDYNRFTKFDNKTFFTKDGFCRGALGSLQAIWFKRQILQNKQKFTSLLKLICDETLPIDKRINEALKGKYSLPGIKIGFISKLLTIHNPKQYYVHNDKFNDVIKRFGLAIPRGISSGKKYELTRNVLKEILQSTNIDDFATFDLWVALNEEI
jgi:HKD family nuclease